MKKVKIISAMIALTLSAYVCLEWHNQGCGWESLIAAIVFYNATIAALAGVICKTIKELRQ